MRDYRFGNFLQELRMRRGLPHGTGVWFDNAQILIQHGKPVSDVIAYRDDVFHYIQKRMERKHVGHTGFAYKIMEDTSRGVYARGAFRMS